MNIGIVVYPGVQLLDVFGPFDFFSAWLSLGEEHGQCSLVAADLSPVTAIYGVEVKPQLSFEQCGDLDVVVIPGGQGRRTMVDDDIWLQAVKPLVASAKEVVAVCTGAFILERLGLLSGQQVATYWRAVPELESLGGVEVLGERIVRSGKYWFSGGVSSGMDLALALIAELSGDDVAGQVQLLMEYFPPHYCFATQRSLQGLPPYSEQPNTQKLPEYIQRYLSSNKVLDQEQ